MSKFCKQCGAEMRDEATFCPKCGTAQSVQNVQTSQSINQVGNTYSPNMGGNTYAPNQVSSSGSSNNETIIIAVVAVLVVAIGAFFVVFNGNVDEVKEALHIGTKQETKVDTATSTSAPAPAGITKEKIAEFINQKDSLDVEIGAVAADINSYLGTHRDFRGRDAEPIINKAKVTLDKVENAKKEVQQATFNKEDEAIKQALISVLDCEVGRIRGLYKGVLDSKNNGDYQIGFKEGTASAYKFDDENAKLNSLYKK